MFKSIVDPNTKNKVSLFGQEGGNILSNYVNVYKKIRQHKNKKSKTDKKNNKNTESSNGNSNSDSNENSLQLAVLL